MARIDEGWAGVDGLLPQHVVDDNAANRNSYAAFPQRIASDFRSEQEVHQGDYRRRQVFELIQNGADAIAEDGTERPGRVHVLLTDTGLYCANEGDPFTAAGINSLRFQLWSSKLGNQIGRFGRGFKSVLALTDQPRVISRSGSFAFSRGRSRQFLLEDERITTDHLGGGDEVPVLAIAEPIDPQSAAADDADLAALMEWATTVIHLPFTVGGRFAGFSPEDRFNLIENDIERFEPEFLIFAKHVQELVLEIRGSRRVLKDYGSEIHRVDSPEDLTDVAVFDCLINDGSTEPRRWTLLEPIPIEIPESFDGLSINRRRGDHGELLPVPIAWAVPTSASQLGKFWSFFPTLDETSLRGILNAPWDTNTERTHLLTTSYNRHLVGRFADLVLCSIPFLKDRAEGDPGAYLEFLPARGREERNPAAEWIAAAVNDGAAQLPTLPDLDGRMCKPGVLRRPPDAVPFEIQRQWAEVPSAPRDLVHPAVADPDRAVRQARMRLYMEAAGADTTMQLTDWLELLVSPLDPRSSIHALEVARALAEQNPLMKDRVRPAVIVMLDDGGTGPCEPSQVYLPLPGARSKAGVSLVHPTVAGDPRSLDTLRAVFGFREVDDAARLEQVVTSWPEEPTSQDWEGLWSVAETISADAAAAVLAEQPGTTGLMVRTMANEWKPISTVLLIGEIVQSPTADPGVTVDEDFHATTLGVLRLLGLSDLPSTTGGSGAWLAEYGAHIEDALRDQGLPDREIRESLTKLPEVPTHLDRLSELSWASAARLCNWAARVPEALSPKHLMAVGVDVEPPVRWLLRRSGVFLTPFGPMPFSSCLSPGHDDLKRSVPIASLPPVVAEALGFPVDMRELPAEVLAAALPRLEQETDDLVIGRVLAAAASKVEAPISIPCRRAGAVIMLPPAQVLAVADPILFNDIVRTGSAAVLVPHDDVAVLIERWGVRGRDAVEESFDYEAVDEPSLLTDTFFLLGEMRGGSVAHIRYQHCARISRVVKSADGRTEAVVEMALEGDLLLVKAGADQPSRLLIAASELLRLGLSEEDNEAILASKRSAEIEEKVAAVRRQIGDEARVRVLLPVRVLRKLLPPALLDEVGPIADDPGQCARLALAVHGTQLLAEARIDLEQMGLRPPHSWAGSAAAVRFVKELGFDSSFAGFSRGDRTAEFRAPGPTDLKPLHGYQRQLVEEVKDLIRHRRAIKDGGWRGLVFLPTGAGKTRVAVQALLEMVETRNLRERVVLWIAQTDELCEQAVQAFKEVWGAIGKSGELVIGRLWGSNSVSSAAETTEAWSAQVVVATISQLTASVVGKSEYEWLRESAVIVTDEAHQADSPEYTRALRWFATGVRQRGADQRPLIGLTATPFKSGPEATRRLQSRFGRKLIQIERPGDVRPEDWSVTAYLRQLGVLAHANHRELEGIRVDLSDDELSGYNATEPKGRAAWLPTAVEDRIASDRERNATLLDSIASLPDDWPVIVFAISVTHAQLLAAQLKLRGIEAASISSSTAPGARHHYIRKFRQGEIRVITNYGVLTTGFDAPETQAIYIARPTFSEGLYMQMIGRGLRGPLNGGKDECLIVDVRDNIERFDGIFAFDNVGYLWGSETTGESMDAQVWASMDSEDTPELE